MSTDDPRSIQLDELTQVAYRLGLVFGEAAERAGTTAQGIELFRLFDRCFFSVRVAIALQLRLGREARVAEREAGRDETLDERDPPDTEAPERYDERDREGDRERASLPILIRTLEGVAADAAALPGPAPAELPTLVDLLARMKAEPAATKSPAAPALRSRLAGSAATLTLERPSAAAPARRATGPPPRSVLRDRPR